MIRTVPLRQLRPELPRVMAAVDGKLDRFVVTKRGRPVAVIVSMDDYESLIETLEILADKRAMAGIRKGQADVRKGRTRSWESIKASLGHL